MQVLLAWSRTKVLVSFRGTASLANALADIQVTHPSNSCKNVYLDSLFCKHLTLTQRFGQVLSAVEMGFCLPSEQVLPWSNMASLFENVASGESNTTTWS